jgi:DNA-binding NtrC family response regulator/PAS domain-containing protein
LAGLKIGLHDQGIYSGFFKELMADQNIGFTGVAGQDYATVLQWLQNGRVDAAVASFSFGEIYSEDFPHVLKTDIFFAPTHLHFIGNLTQGTPWLASLDRHLTDLKKDKASLYYTLLKRYHIKPENIIKPKTRVPPWMHRLFWIITAMVAVLAILSVVLEIRVKQKTRELAQTNREVAQTNLELGRTNRELKQEIRDRKTTQVALVEKERTLASLIESLPGMVYRWGPFPDPVIEFVNQGRNDLVGLPCETLVSPGKIPLKAMVHPEDWPEVSRAMQAAVDSTYDLIYRMKSVGAPYKWISDRGGCLRSDDGEITGYEGFISAITRQQETEIELRQENRQLKESLKERYRFKNIIGKSEAMQVIFTSILSAGKTPDPVIIYGESGTGKELVARAIHDISPRKERPFVAVNCGAIPETLIESELFGHKKGAFTGAVADKTGYLGKADTGSLFLDEIGDISLAMQVKLLRALEGGGYTPVGGTRLRTPDIRVVAATNKDLKQMVADGTMREDFFYRIHVIPIHLPPLRARREDIPLLVDHFLKASPNQPRPHLGGNVLEAFIDYHWPGNIRELRNTLHRYLTLKQVDFLEKPLAAAQDRPVGLDPGYIPVTDLKTAVKLFEKAYIKNVLDTNDWQRVQVADILKINRRTLFNKIKSLELDPES